MNANQRAEQVYGLLLRLYPKAFRAAYETEMRQVFRDLWHDFPGDSLLRFWLRIGWDVALSAFQERINNIMHAHKAGDWLLIAASLHIGMVLGWVDSRPGWDDTGISAGAVFLAAAFFGALRPTCPWRWALTVGCGIPLLAIVHTRNYGSLLALVFAFAGAYAGSAARRRLFPTGDTGGSPA